MGKRIHDGRTSDHLPTMHKTKSKDKNSIE